MYCIQLFCHVFFCQFQSETRERTQLAVLGSLQFSFRIAFIPKSKSKPSEMSSSNLLRPRCCSCVTDGLRGIDKFSSSPFASCDKKHRRRGRQRERQKTIVLISKTLTPHVHYTFWYISLPSSAKQRREMTKFKVLWRT